MAQKNSLSFTVFRRPALNKSTTSFLLTILAFTDTLTVYFILFARWLRLLTGFLLETSSLLSCRVFNYFNFVFFAMSNWTLVLITMERVIAVTKPHKVQSLCTKRNAGLAIISVLIINCIVCIPLFAGFEPQYFFIFDKDDTTFIPYVHCNYCCIMKKAALKLFVFAMINFIPFFSILFGNITILFSLARNRNIRHAMTSASDTKNIKSDKKQSLTTTLLLVSFTYLVLTLPYLLHSLISSSLVNMFDSLSEYLCNMMLQYVSTISVLCINYSVNFILYCIGGKRFRNEFLIMIGCNNAVTSKPTMLTDVNLQPSRRLSTSKFQ